MIKERQREFRLVQSYTANPCKPWKQNQLSELVLVLYPNILPLRQQQAKGRKSRAPFISPQKNTAIFSPDKLLTSDVSEGGARVPKRGLVRFSQNFGLKHTQKYSKLPYLSYTAHLTGTAWSCQPFTATSTVWDVSRFTHHTRSNTTHLAV